MGTEFTPLASTIGGALIGLAAMMLMVFNGRIAGISGIIGRLFPPYDGADPGGAAAFVIGLLAAPLPLQRRWAHPLRKPCPAMSVSWRSPDFSSDSAQATEVAVPAAWRLRDFAAVVAFRGGHGDLHDNRLHHVFLMRHMLGA